MYGTQTGSNSQTLYRYSDTYGLVSYVGGNYWLLWTRTGPNGALASVQDAQHSPIFTMWSLAPQGGTPLLHDGQSIPGLPSPLHSVYTPYIAMGAQDGSWIVHGQLDNEQNYILRAKAGQPLDLLTSSSGVPVAYDTTPVVNGPRALAFMVFDGIALEDDYRSPLHTVFAYDQQVAADGRVWYGASLVRGWLDGGFLAKANIYDSPQETQYVGQGFLVFNQAGQYLGGLLCGDTNPQGGGTVADPVLATASRIELDHAKDSCMVFNVRLADVPTDSQYAYWRLGRDGSKAVEIQAGQAVPGTSHTVGGMLLVGTTADGGSMYSIMYKDTRVWQYSSAYAKYKPGLGLHYDFKAQGDDQPYDWVLSGQGPCSSRVYGTDSGKSIWLAKDTDTAGPQLVAYPGKPLQGSKWFFTGVEDVGSLPHDQIALEAYVGPSPTGPSATTALCIQQGNKLVYLLDYQLPLDGKQISAAHFVADYRSWVATADKDRPLIRIDFTDGTSGIYVMSQPAILSGDINADGYINVGDLQLLVAAWGSDNSGAWGNWNPDVDFNSDGCINTGDLQILVANWGRSVQ